MITRFQQATLFVLLAIFLALPLAAQPGTTGAGNSWVSLPITLTDDIYWAAQNPELQKIRQMVTGVARDQITLDLARAGFIIDVPIHAWGWSPSITMYLRAQYGFTWVNNALEPQGGGNGPVPPGKVKVSIDAKDYPAFPKPEPPAVGTNLVGPQLFGNLYTYGPGAIRNGKFIVTDGQIINEGGKQYRARVNAFAIGTQVYFELIGLSAANFNIDWDSNPHAFEIYSRSWER